MDAADLPVRAAAAIARAVSERHRADPDAFLLRPIGLALAADDTLYVTGPLDNVINAIPKRLEMLSRGYHPGPAHSARLRPSR